MTIIGFDVSKNELVGARANKSGLLKESLTLENTRNAIAQFLEEAQQQYPHLLVASEATAEYHRILAEECIARSIPFRLINPILTKQFTRATIRKQKTDRTDALIIAKLALAGEGTMLRKESLHPAKSIARVAYKLARMERMLAAMRARIMRVFPGEITMNAIIEHPRKTMEHSVHALRSYLIQQVDANLAALLASIPGVGPTLAATFIAEIGSIHQFSSGKSLVAYAGMNNPALTGGVSYRASFA